MMGSGRTATRAIWSAQALETRRTDMANLEAADVLAMR
jgi:hypothetical protein